MGNLFASSTKSQEDQRRQTLEEYWQRQDLEDYWRRQEAENLYRQRIVQKKRRYEQVDRGYVSQKPWKLSLIINVYNDDLLPWHDLLRISRCQNPTLYGQYLLKKEEMKSRYGNVNVQYMFHGTNISNLDNIFKYNLDWRRHGNKIGNRYGKGASFSKIAAYSSHYCDKKVNVKVMIVFEVLISNCCNGDNNMILPDIYDRRTKLRYDTAVKDNKGSVVVKFSDYEFYPMFKLEFRGYPKAINNGM
ncbi:poly [ADP-ribose] polymerase 12-like [Ctenocephalides felis]|uniref:poly [ADP-ribose] polymerase 12-like n=1 Tax=Ctenocephalides felis TaxID=7515 RepID=UPI000E6E40C8|nr:poly [ADP-ribose] polymerase 12-like [Ctenocephalides felis]